MKIKTIKLKDGDKPEFAEVEKDQLTQIGYGIYVNPNTRELFLEASEDFKGEWLQMCEVKEDNTNE